MPIFSRLPMVIFQSSLLAVLLPDLASAQVSFNRQVRPILSQHCTVCHGPDESSREADLRLDTFEDATADLGGYAAIVPGDPDNSELIVRVSSQDDPMPPQEHGQGLSVRETGLLKRWIEEGARYQVHWSFAKPVLPAVPELENDPWSRNTIDRFVFKKLQSEELLPNGQADPARLIRRLALDLTGLPPDRELVDLFVANPVEATYERIVDTLLNDPAYGEHWASMWLDLARYADTVGYAGDEKRTIWPWRDWVIQALNNNMPFDQFTLELLAGDLLPDPTQDQKLATAFHRNTLINNEGGTNDEEFRTIAIKDRISTTLNTWMGLTVRCAECHSHKYDPISHREYYAFLDFFNQTEDADRADENPRIEMRPEGLAFTIRALDEQIAELRRKQAKQPAVWQIGKPTDLGSRNGTSLRLQTDHSVLATGTNPAAEEYTLGFRLRNGTYTGLRIEVLPSAYHGGNVGRGTGGAFVMTQVRVSTDSGNGEKPVQVPLSNATVDLAREGLGAEHLVRGSFATDADPLGWGIPENHTLTGPATAVLSFEKAIVVSSSTRVAVHLVFNSQWLHQNAGRVRVSFTGVSNPAKKHQSRQLDPLSNRLENLVRQRNSPVAVPVLAELVDDKRRVTHIMKRGNYRSLGDAVQSSVPAAFHEFPVDSPRNRLGVAQWLIHEDNPLTARVTVNRYWARLFGRGIVVTEEDFGTQGSPPSHPELLDWMAIDFRGGNWDTKRMVKQIVMSSTYRQSNRASNASIDRDPKNILLARGPRVRLSAEIIRDQSLAVSGLLQRRMFGPPVYPPNPIKEVVNAFKGADVWKTSTGEDRYRRAIYTFLKRSQPHPLFETFDTATRDVCSLRRINTNTPLQAFMTLNDEAFVEAACALAIRMAGESTPEEQVGRGLEIALVRAPDSQKIPPLVELYQTSLASFLTQPEQARKLPGAFSGNYSDDQLPHLAALTVVANVILNLDEFLTH